MSIKDWYLFYAIRRFGWRDGLHRFWTYRLSPLNTWTWACNRYESWRLIDRRRKLRNWSRTVYAVNRDGDLGLVECPVCHNYQNIIYSKQLHAFECCLCVMTFQIYLEDGLLTIRDHREGNVKTPAKVVTDDHGIKHLGISRDAPWWWERREAYRDYNPKNGKDGHGHEPYKLLGPPRPHPSPPSEMEEDAP